MKSRAVLAVGVVLACCSFCFAWGPEGHRIVVRIAESYLTPKTAVAAADLLGKESLTDVAVWADEARKHPEYAWSKPFHGATVPDDKSAFKFDRDCSKGCAVSAILRFSDVLEDPKADRKTKIEALKFLVHFVGDLHQPVHVTSARSTRTHRTDVVFFSEPVKLHFVWDAGLIRHVGKPWEQYAAELRGKIKPAQFTKWAAITDPGVWATESHELAVHVAYDLPDDGKIGQVYFDRCIPVVNERLSMAGVRLGVRLNEIFDPTSQARRSRAVTTRPSSVHR